MRAAVTRTTGLVEVIDVATPEPGTDELRLRVAAATLNPADGAVVAGVFAATIHQPEHTGLGWDAAGTVTAVGAGTAARHPELAVGTRVAVLSAGFDKPLGALADELVVPADAAAVVPADLDLTAAATVPLNSLTADQALDLLGEPSGTLLVTGAAGAVGGYAVPLAVTRGWQVLGLARESDREFVETAGARLVTTLDGVTVDAVLDPAGLGAAALAVARDGGRYVSFTGPVEGERGIESAFVQVHPDGDRLGELLALTVSGRLPARLDRTFPLAEVAAAFDRVAEPGARGRVVVLP